MSPRQTISNWELRLLEAAILNVYPNHLRLTARDANDAVDGLGSEMSRRRTREHQGHVRELDLGPSGDADLQRGWPLSLKRCGVSVAGNA